MHREEMPRVFGGVAELFAELDNDLVEGAGGAVVVVAPDVVEEFIAGEDLAGMGLEKLKEF